MQILCGLRIVQDTVKSDSAVYRTPLSLTPHWEGQRGVRYTIGQDTDTAVLNCAVSRTPPNHSNRGTVK